MNISQKARFRICAVTAIPWWNACGWVECFLILSISFYSVTINASIQSPSLRHNNLGLPYVRVPTPYIVAPSSLLAYYLVLYFRWSGSPRQLIYVHTSYRYWYHLCNSSQARVVESQRLILPQCAVSSLPPMLRFSHCRITHNQIPTPKQESASELHLSPPI
jgi:hypothetical protein